MRRSLLRKWSVLLMTIATITLNGMAPLLSPTGKNVGNISDQFQNYFTPAGYVFSIWGLIYLALLAFSVYQLLPAQQENETIAKIDIPYMVSCVFNMSWIIVWQREWFPVSLVCMIGLLISLIWIYLALDSTREQDSLGEQWFTHWPFSVYLGWVTVATVANATTVLQYFGWKGGGIPEPVWSALMLCIALGIVLAAAFPRRDRAYILVLAWTSLGIMLKYQASIVVTIASGLTLFICMGVVIYLYVRPLPKQATQ